MKRIGTLFMLAWLGLQASGQVTVIPGRTVIPDSLSPAAANAGNPSTAAQTKKLNYGASVGTSFGFASGYGSGLSTYVSPYLTYQVSPRFSIKAGFSVINTQLFDYHPLFIPESLTTGYTGNYTSTLLYVQGQYLLGKNLVLNGTAFKEFPIAGEIPGSPYSNYKGMQGFSMDVSYKLGEHVFIQAGVNYLNGGRPYYYTPGYPVSPVTGGYSPFGW